MESVNTQVEENKYKLQFETNNRNNYRAMQYLAQICVDGKELILVGYPPDDTQNIEFTPVRYGYWKDSDLWPTCSLCKTCFCKYDGSGQLQNFSYCPACGAKMEA